ncbi:MAG: YfhO family protein, partial [Chloroflexota bacterium]
LWALVLVYFWPMISPLPFGQMFIVEGDFTNQFYPFHHFAAREWWRGRIPLWNPYILGGHPFQADPQSAVFYPLNLLVCFFGGFGGLSLEALQWQLVLNYLLAATFMFLFVRELTGRTLAAAIGSIAFTFSGFLTSYPMQQMPILESSVWLPLILLFLERAVSQPGRRIANLGLAGLGLGITILAGHPQTALYVAYTALAYYLFRGIVSRLSWSALLMGVDAFLLVGFGVAAVQVLPTVEFYSMSTRESALGYGWSGTGYGLDSLPGLLLSGWMGEKALFVGSVSVVLVVAAWLIPRGQTIFWTIVATFAVLVSLGKNGLVFPLLYALAPGFSLFQHQERVMLVLALAIGVLASLGCRNLLELRERSMRRWQLALLPVVPLLLVCWASVLAWKRSSGWDVSSPVWSCWLRLAAIVVACLVVVVLMWRSSGRFRAALGLALALLVAADLFGVNFGNNLSPTNPLPSPELVEAVSSLQNHPEPFRIVADDSEVFPINYGCLALAPQLTGDTPITLQRTAAVLSQQDHWRVWQLFNVKFFITRKAVGDGFELVCQIDDISIYHVTYSMPRIWVVNDVRVAGSEREALALALDPMLHPGRTVVLERQPGLKLSPEQELHQTWRIVGNKSWWFKAEIETTADGIFVLSEAYHPGWRAYVDGREVPILRADYALKAVELPAGKHIVEMHYRPLSFWAGLLISALTLVMIAVVTIRTKLAKSESFPRGGRCDG